MYVLVLPHARVYLGTCARAWVRGTALRRYWVGLDYSTILYQSLTILFERSLPRRPPRTQRSVSPFRTVHMGRGFGADACTRMLADLRIAPQMLGAYSASWPLGSNAHRLDPQRRRRS